jgi:hypothetical protein
METVSYTTIIPDRFQSELIEIGSISSNTSFAIGDITNEIRAAWQRVKSERPDRAIPEAEIYAAVGAFCGKSARTIREYSAIAAFYPPEVREDFPILRFDHFRTAMVLGPRWESALRWAVDEADSNGGRPATVDKMIAKFAVVPEMPADNPDPIEDAGPQSAAEITLGNALAEVAVIQTFVTTVGKLRTVLPRAGLSNENVRRAEELLSEILDILSTI